MSDAGTHLQPMIEGYSNFESAEMQIAHEIGSSVHNLIFHGEVTALGVITIMFVIGILWVMYWAFKYR